MKTISTNDNPHQAKPVTDGPRANEDITSPKVRLIGAEGENLDVVDIKKAMFLAREAGLDLVEISPNVEPPVCKILDLGKYKYEAQKRKAEAKKKQKVVDIKELKLSPNIETHDYEVKLKKAKEFIADGNKVKFSLKFKGREMSYNQKGFEVLAKYKDDLDLIAKVELEPKLEGRQAIMIVAPK